MILSNDHYFVILFLNQQFTALHPVERIREQIRMITYSEMDDATIPMIFRSINISLYLKQDELEKTPPFISLTLLKYI